VVIWHRKAYNLHIPELIPELYFLYAKYFPGEWNNATQSSKFSEKDNEFEYIFVIICKYIYEPC
jgi:hypothetical protein